MRIMMKGVREYAEGMSVDLGVSGENRLVVIAKNEGGYNCTEVDLIDLIEWISDPENGNAASHFLNEFLFNEQCLRGTP